MYTPNSQKEFIDALDTRFKSYKLYTCNEDIICEKGVFSKGSLVRIQICGRNNIGSESSFLETTQEIFAKYDNVYLRITDMDDYYTHIDNRPYPNSQDYYHINKHTTDGAFIFDMFESVPDLEKDLDKEKEKRYLFLDKSDKYLAGMYFSILMGILFTLLYVLIGFTSEMKWTAPAIVMPFIIFGVGFIIAVMLGRKSDSYYDRATTNQRSIDIYKRWKEHV